MRIMFMVTSRREEVAGSHLFECSRGTGTKYFATVGNFAVRYKSAEW